MLETYLRPLYQLCIADPIARCMKNVSPERITYASCLTGLLVLPALMLNLPSFAITLLIMSGFLDTLDGTLARMDNKASNTGCVLDIISDRIVELAIIIGLFAIDPVHRGWMTLAMLGSCYLCITSFLVVGIFSTNYSKKGFHYSPGLIERAEAFIFFILMIWLPNYFSILAGLFTMLVLFTSYLRIKQFIKANETRAETQYVPEG